MNLISILQRLDNAFACPDLTQSMTLLPHVSSDDWSDIKKFNFVVGYNGSPRSQTGLELALWLADETRQMTQKPVGVQAVYVADLANQCKSQGPIAPAKLRKTNRQSLQRKKPAVMINQASCLTHAPDMKLGKHPVTTVTMPEDCRVQQFSQADHILWQARNAAAEWHGEFTTHLRFGSSIAQELTTVAAETHAQLVFLGCTTAEHSLPRQLVDQLACSLLGIPITLS